MSFEICYFNRYTLNKLLRKSQAALNNGKEKQLDNQQQSVIAQLKVDLSQITPWANISS